MFRANTLLWSTTLLLLSACSTSEPPAEQVLTQVSVKNSGVYTMHSPQRCYYQPTDEKVCSSTTKGGEIKSGMNESFFIRANEKVRIVLPYDFTERVAGNVYRTNCHILVELIPRVDIAYLIDAKIEASKGQPEKGFNCFVDVYEVHMEGNKKSEEAVTHIRYRSLGAGESRDTYINDYFWEISR